MGYRGSKSETINKHPQPNLIYNSVKEQRVDGSWLLANKANSLRCTLMGFARNYQVKILSKQIHNNSKYYSINAILFPGSCPLITLDPWYLTGLIDAEGSFQIRRNPKYKTGWVVSPPRFFYSLR